MNEPAHFREQKIYRHFFLFLLMPRIHVGGKCEKQTGVEKLVVDTWSAIILDGFVEIVSIDIPSGSGASGDIFLFFSFVSSN